MASVLWNSTLTALQKAVIKPPSFPLPGFDTSWIFLTLGFKMKLSCSIFRDCEPLFRCQICNISIISCLPCCTYQTYRLLAWVHDNWSLCIHNIPVQLDCGWEWEFNSNEKKPTHSLSPRKTEFAQLRAWSNRTRHTKYTQWAESTSEGLQAGVN